MLATEIVASGLRLAIAVVGKTGTGRNETTDDDVLLEATQFVPFAHDRGFGQHSSGFLEGRRGDERIRRQGRLGDAEQNVVVLCRQLAFGQTLSFSSSTSERSTCSSRMKRLSPASVMTTRRSIWRTITSMCLSLIFTPCRR